MELKTAREIACPSIVFHKRVVAHGVQAFRADSGFCQLLSKLEGALSISTRSESSVPGVGVYSPARAAKLSKHFAKTIEILLASEASHHIHKVMRRCASLCTEAFEDKRAAAKSSGLNNAIQQYAPKPSISLAYTLGQVVIGNNCFRETSSGGARA